MDRAVADDDDDDDDDGDDALVVSVVMAGVRVKASISKNCHEKARRDANWNFMLN